MIVVVRPQYPVFAAITAHLIIDPGGALQGTGSDLLGGAGVLSRSAVSWCRDSVLCLSNSSCRSIKSTYNGPSL